MNSRRLRLWALVPITMGMLAEEPSELTPLGGNFGLLSPPQLIDDEITLTGTVVTTEQVTISDGDLTFTGTLVSVVINAPVITPSLAIRRDGAELVVEWTEPGFRVETSADLAADAGWQEVAATPSGATSVRLAPDSVARYFRLRAR